MSRNEGYLDKNRIPKLAKLVVIPMREATTRLAALRSGQVDWIEVPPPDAIPSLKAAGFQISLWPYPHVWPYIFNVTEKSAFRNRRVRIALNYAIERDELVKFLNGTAKPAYGLYPPENPYFGKPEQRYGHDPEKAKALLAEAGYGLDHPLEAKIMISTSGSGQMVPLPMNEILQQQVQPVGFKLDFDVVDWGTMLVVKRSAPSAPVAHGVEALNNSLGFSDPASMFRYFSTTSFSPSGINWVILPTRGSTTCCRARRRASTPSSRSVLQQRVCKLSVPLHASRERWSSSILDKGPARKIESRHGPR
jgi:ABC-type transport system substrate-binding protein